MLLGCSEFPARQVRFRQVVMAAGDEGRRMVPGEGQSLLQGLQRLMEVALAGRNRAKAWASVSLGEMPAQSWMMSRKGL